MRNKGFIVPILAILLTFLVLVLISISIFSKQKNISVSTTSLTTKVLPTYSPERKKQDEEITKINESVKSGSEGLLTFNLKNNNAINSQYHVNISTLTKGSVEAVTCLTVKDNIYANLVNVDKRTDDINIPRFTKQIESYKYSDELSYTYQDGRIVTENKGKTSLRVISYSAVCKLNNQYFFLYSGSGPTVHVGGGGSEPSHFAFTDGMGNVIIFDNVISHAAHIQLPKSNDPNDYSIPTSTTNVAYYGCNEILAANDLEVIIRCGGGDGPSSAGSIFRVDLGNRTILEKAFCSFTGVGKYAQLCYDENGVKYYEQFNSQ
jgi:hypothetical protein